MWGVMTIMISDSVLFLFSVPNKYLISGILRDPRNSNHCGRILIANDSSNDTGLTFFETDIMLYFTVGKNGVIISA